MIPSNCWRRYLVSNDIMLAVSKYNNCEICPKLRKTQIRISN